MSVIFPDRVENINQFAIGDGKSAMPNIRRHNSEQALLQYLRNVVYGKFKFSFNNKRALLMDMLMAENRITGFNFYKIYGISVGMN